MIQLNNYKIILTLLTDYLYFVISICEFVIFHKIMVERSIVHMFRKLKVDMLQVKMLFKDLKSSANAIDGILRFL